jgi:PPOX class probable F420-dependent enzyme
VASKRSQIEMSEDEMQAFLADGRDLQVASINRDGTPHLVTMWYLVQDGVVGFWTYGKSQKVLNLRRDPRVTVLVATGARYEELRGVSIAGRAELVEEPDALLAFGLRLHERYWGPVDDVARARVGKQAT